MLLARGSRALHIFRHTFELTMEHLTDLGGKLAPQKSKVFASISSHRTWLASYVWTPIAQQINVVHNLRDLGSALNLSSAGSTAHSQ
eukprot:6464227-Karenia_brevis.AAC.1